MRMTRGVPLIPRVILSHLPDHVVFCLVPDSIFRYAIEIPNYGSKFCGLKHCGI